jgi:hypothetical protein
METGSLKKDGGLRTHNPSAKEVKQYFVLSESKL